MGIKVNVEVASQKPPCIMSHVEVYLVWRNQGNGYNYFHCAHCDYVKFDFESGKIKVALQQVRQEERERAAKIAENHGHSNGKILGSHKHIAKAIREST